MSNSFSEFIKVYGMDTRQVESILQKQYESSPKKENQELRNFSPWNLNFNS